MGHMKDLHIDLLNSHQYFARVDQAHWTPRNNAEKQAQKLARDHGRQILLKRDVEGFIRKMNEDLNLIMLANPRCKPLDFYWHEDNGDIIIYCSGVFRFVLEWAKG